jgi:hypothetical protein
LQVICLIAVTALLGLAVNLSTFLALGSVSSVVFNGKPVSLLPIHPVLKI